MPVTRTLKLDWASHCAGNLQAMKMIAYNIKLHVTLHKLAWFEVPTTIKSRLNQLEIYLL